VRDRIELVDEKNPKISMRQQCKLLGVARSTVTYKPVEEDPEDTRIKRLLDEIYMIDPCLGSRRLVTVLARDYVLRTELVGGDISELRSEDFHDISPLI